MGVGVCVGIQIKCPLAVGIHNSNLTLTLHMNTS